VRHSGWWTRGAIREARHRAGPSFMGWVFALSKASWRLGQSADARGKLGVVAMVFPGGGQYNSARGVDASHVLHWIRLSSVLAFGLIRGGYERQSQCEGTFHAKS
jgi:hypothetical protein